MILGSSTTAYARPGPCIDDKGHRFTASRPPAGSYGYALIICERCGKRANP